MIFGTGLPPFAEISFVPNPNTTAIQVTDRCPMLCNHTDVTAKLHSMRFKSYSMAAFDMAVVT
jgi:hypothetical protein